MKELDMIKTYAKLNGIEVHERKGYLIESKNYSDLINEICRWRLSEDQCIKLTQRVAYNPITNFTLNCEARDKYEITIEYGRDVDYITHEFTLIEVMCRSQINKAVIECVLKSRGLYL